MKLISTFVHGVFDYVLGTTLLFLPNLFGFADVGGAAELIPRALGGMILLQSLATRYELGFIKLLPMQVHLLNDYFGGILMATSPLIFGFHKLNGKYWATHVLLGIGIFFFTLLTEKQPRDSVIGEPKTA